MAKRVGIGNSGVTKAKADRRLAHRSWQGVVRFQGGPQRGAHARHRRAKDRAPPHPSGIMREKVECYIATARLSPRRCGGSGHSRSAAWNRSAVENQHACTLNPAAHVAGTAREAAKATGDRHDGAVSDRHTSQGCATGDSPAGTLSSQAFRGKLGEGSTITTSFLKRLQVALSTFTRRSMRPRARRAHQTMVVVPRLLYEAQKRETIALRSRNARCCVDHGTYPYVTDNGRRAAAPGRLGPSGLHMFGITKALRARGVGLSDRARGRCRKHLQAA